MEQILNDGVGVSCEMIIKDGDKILMGKEVRFLEKVVGLFLEVI